MSNAILEGGIGRLHVFNSMKAKTPSTTAEGTSSLIIGTCWVPYLPPQQASAQAEPDTSTWSVLEYVSYLSSALAWYTEFFPILSLLHISLSPSVAS